MIFAMPLALELWVEYLSSVAVIGLGEEWSLPLLGGLGIDRLEDARGIAGSPDSPRFPMRSLRLGIVEPGVGLAL